MAKLELEKKLKYAVASINEVSFKDLIDCGANQCLILEELATRLGLMHSKDPRRVKAIDQPY